MFKRITSLLLALSMVLSVVPAQVFAVEAESTEPVAETVAVTTAPETAETECVPVTEAQDETIPVEPEPAEATVSATAPEETAGEVVTEEAAAAGACGDSLQWSLSGGVLTITGTGAMKKYNSEEYVPWYYNRERITQIILPEGLTYISQFAFWGCANLTEITLPSTLEGIEKSAFASCSSLRSVVIPDKVRYLQERAFYGCESLETVVLGNGMVTLYENAFMYCSSLREVDLGNSLKYIRGAAFCYCENLETLSIPKSVEYIYENAFASCGIRELTIEGDPIWSGRVFSCPNLEVITIGSELSTLPSGTFNMCPSLTDFVVDSGNPYFTAKNGVLFNKDRTTLLRYTSGIAGDYEIPEGVTRIEEYAFYQSVGLSRVDIPDSVTEIQKYAFSNCEGLTHVAIPDSVKEIGGEAFMGCTALEYAEIGRGVQKIQYRAFQNCTAMTKVVIPDSVTELGSEVFSGCTKLRDFTIGSGVKSIGEYAFNNCTALTSIILPDNVTSVGGYLFINCKNLRTVTLSQNLTSIPSSMFSGSGLTRVTIPASVTSIGSNAFSYCEQLEEVTFSEGLVTIGTGAFGGCDRLTTMIFPDSLTTLGDSAFSECANLETVVLGGQITKINNYTFSGCNKLKQIMIPACVTSIGTGAFRPLYNQESALRDVYFGGSEAQWNAISIGKENEALQRATIHFNYSPEGPVLLTELRYYDHWDPSRQRVYFGEKSSAVTAETDASFREDPKALLGSYVMVEVKVQWGIETLISMKPVQVMAGVVTAMDETHIVIGGETYGMPEGIAELDGYVGMYVLYYVFEGRIVRLERLNISDYLDNNAITINGPGSAFAYYLTGPRQIVFYQVNGTSGTVLSDDKGVVRIPLGTFRVAVEQKVPIEITRIGDAIFEPAVTLEATVKVTPITFTQTWEGSLDAGIGIALSAGGEVEFLGNNFTATLGKLGASGNMGNTLSISRSYSESGESLELTTNVKASAGAEVKSGITAKTIKSEFGVIEASAGVKSSITGLYGIKFPEYTMENGAQQAAIATYFLGETLKMYPNTVLYWGFYNMLREYVYEESGAIIIHGSGAGVNGTIGAAAGKVEVDDVTVFEAIGAGTEASSSYSKKYFSNGEVEKNAAYALEENLSLYALGAGSGEVSYQAGGLLSADFLGKDISVTAQKTDKGNVLDATFLSANAVGFNTFILEKNYTSQYGHYEFRDDPLTYLSYNTSCINSFVNGDRKILTAANLGEIAQFLSDSYFRIPYSQRTKEQVVYSLPLTFGLGLGVEADLGVTLSYMESTNYDTAMGFATEDEIRLVSESENAAAVVAREKMSLPELMLGSMSSLAKAAGEFFVSVGNSIVDGVESAWAWITGKPDSGHDRSVSITSARGGGDGYGHSAWGVSYNVDIRSDAGARTNLPNGVIAGASTGANYEFSKAATIGRPFVISVTDNATGENITDFSDEPLEFTIRYASEDLEAAGLSAHSAVVLDGGIAMYRYSDNGDYFEYIGGINDLTAMTVTAEITKPGQYVLAVDSCAPAISALDLSDFRSTPTITARIDDLSGLDVSRFVFKLDGVIKVDAKNIAEHFNSKTGLFTYAVTEPLSEGQHTMSFTLTDTTGNSETYEYSFNVDLTAPVISDVTVSGATNEGSAVEIRAQVSDENLTSVYALFSKKLPDGTWTAEVGAEMGNMGDGLWGLDYEGDGSSVKVRICATDVAENQTFSAVFEAKPQVERVEVAQDYLALRVGQSQSLTAQVKPAEMASSLTWCVEEGSEKVISVDENGNVTAKASGTGYVLAEATDGEVTLTARCRIDVAESLELDGVRLSTDKVTTELYSTDYTKLDILLLLPQNYAAASDTSSGIEKLSAAISEAYFTAPEVAALFELKVLDDRTVEIVPTADAINSNAIAKSYTGTITVNVEGTDYITDNLTLTVKKTLPKLKVTIPAFNSFYSGQSQAIQVTGATVTNIYAETLPEWLALSDNQLYLTENAPQKNASGKASLEIWTEEWAVPVYVTATVKNTYKTPGLKLSATSVQLSDQPGSSQGVNLQLQPKNKKETLSDLFVRSISASEGYTVENYADGSFTLKAEPDFKPGKINLEVSFTNTDETVQLPITVKTAQVKLKLEKTSISLNAEVGDSAVVAITATPNDYVLSAPSFRLTDNVGSDKMASGELEVRYEDGAVRINTTENTPIGANYKLMITAGGSKEVTLKIKTVGGTPSVSLKQSSNLDLSFGDAALVTASFKNYSGGKIAKFSYTVTEMKGKEVLNQNVPYFTVESDGGSNFQITCTEPGSVDIKNSYTLNLKLTLADGNAYEASLKLKIKRTAIKLKLSSSKQTLNKAINDMASVAVSCTTKGYEFVKPVWQLMDKSGKVSADGKLDIRWSNGNLIVATNDATEFGATYKLLVAAEEGAAATALTVSILAENKSQVTSTLKVKGNLDVIRDGSSITVTPSYKNCMADTVKIEELLVVRSDNQVVTDQFDIVKNADGTYTITKAKGAEIDLNLKYQVQMMTTINGIAVSAKPANLSVKMGSAKLTAETDGTLFAKDKNSRMNLRFTTTDAALNGVARVEIKDAKQAELFEIYDYGNGEFAIGFKAGVNPAAAGKSINLTLNVYLDGNISTKPDASVKLKLSITP